VRGFITRPLGQVLVAAAIALSGGGIYVATTGGGGGETITCNHSATSGADLTSDISAASNGQTICLTNTGSYGAFAGTSKSVTIISQSGTGAPNPVANSMTLSLGSGDSNFTIDGGMENWDSPVGLNLNGGTIQAGVTDVTFRDFKSTGAGRLWVFDPGPSLNSGITIDHGHFYDVLSGEAVIYVDHTSGEPGNTGLTIQNSLFRHSSADGVKLSNGAQVNIINNKFLEIKECLPSCSGNHTDAIQFFSGDGSVVRGNWVDDCEQAISGFDGQSSALIEHNLVTNCNPHWFTYMADSPASTVQFNTVGDSGGAINCGGKSGLATASDTMIRNNVARAIVLTGEGPTCTPDQNTNNLVNSGATGGNINGTPVFEGTAEYDDFCLASGSPGLTGATDGGQVGICGGSYSASTYGPPEGEGY